MNSDLKAQTERLAAWMDDNPDHPSVRSHRQLPARSSIYFRPFQQRDYWNVTLDGNLRPAPGRKNKEIDDGGLGG